MTTIHCRMRRSLFAHLSLKRQESTPALQRQETTKRRMRGAGTSSAKQHKQGEVSAAATSLVVTNPTAIIRSEYTSNPQARVVRDTCEDTRLHNGVFRCSRRVDKPTGAPGPGEGKEVDSTGQHAQGRGAQTSAAHASRAPKGSHVKPHGQEELCRQGPSCSPKVRSP